MKQDVYQGKYSKLYDCLSITNKECITFTYQQLEYKLGFKLPQSAYKHRHWWANEARGSHVQVRSWMSAGWRVKEVNLGYSITFERFANIALVK